jgi:hypothetical protein
LDSCRAPWPPHQPKISAGVLVVGWVMRDHMRTELPLVALMMATQR